MSHWCHINVTYFYDSIVLIYVILLLWIVYISTIHIYSVVEFWKILAKNPSSADRVIETFLEMLKQSMPYEEKTSSADKKTSEKVATLQPLSVNAFIQITELAGLSIKYNRHNINWIPLHTYNLNLVYAYDNISPFQYLPSICPIHLFGLHIHLDRNWKYELGMNLCL